jgi:hypothetical protein
MYFFYGKWLTCIFLYKTFKIAPYTCVNFQNDLIFLKKKKPKTPQKKGGGHIRNFAKNYFKILK